MKQILQNLKTGDIEIAEIPVPSVKPGHLLIKSSKSLISLGTERMLLEFGKAGWIEKARRQPEKVKQVLQKIKTDGLFPTIDAVFNKLDQPLPLGYSNSGVVLETGKGVCGFKPGDRVASNGYHAQIVCVPENLCSKIPGNVDDLTAAFTVLASISLQGVRLINPSLGESVAVMGLGLLGLLACQILRANGCRVIGFDFDQKKISISKTFGIEAFDLSSGIDPVEAGKAFSRGHGVDAVLITASTKSDDPIHQAPRMCRKRGRVVLLGVTGLNLSRDDFYKKEISFQVSCSYGPGRYENDYEKKGLDYPIGFVRWTENRNFEAVLDLMAAGQIKTQDLVSKIVPIEKAHEAYEMIAGGENVLGIVLDYDGVTEISRKSVSLSGPPKNPKTPVIGFLGAGNFASSVLIPAFRETGARLKTIASYQGLSGTHVGRKNGFEISTTDLKFLLSDPEINCIVICTQHDSHASMILQAIEAGKNVFVEKPLCLTFEDLNKIEKAFYEARKTNNLKLMVGFNRRFSKLGITCRKLLGNVHEPKSFIMTVNSGKIPSDHWTQDADAGGGRIIGEGCHFVDFLRFLAGVEIVETKAIFLENAANHDVLSDTGSISISFQDGSIGTIHYFSNGHRDFPKERLEVFCGGRILVLDNFRTLSGFGWKKFSQESLWTQDKGHRTCVNAFIKAVEDDSSNPIPFEEIIEVSKAVLIAGKANR